MSEKAIIITISGFFLPIKLSGKVGDRLNCKTNINHEYLIRRAQNIKKYII